MNKRSLALIAAAAVLVGGLAVAQTTMKGMDDGFGWGRSGLWGHAAFLKSGLLQTRRELIVS